MVDRRDVHVPRHVLVTGGAGFIGCNFVRFLLATDATVRVVTLDALTYAGLRDNLADVERTHPDRHRFVHGDITDGQLVDRLLSEERIDTVVHLAAETHVDRSIDDPAAFVHSNVTGTFTLLEATRRAWRGRDDVRFHHVSTDEVYGTLGQDGRFTESTPYDPSSPYSASKAAADHLVRAWHRTFKFPATLSNCSNNYGPYQFPEKLMPLMIRNAISKTPLPVYGDGGNVRDWLYVEDHCRALDVIVRRGVTGRTYNVGGDSERTNLEIVTRICDLVDECRPEAERRATSLITFVADRPGHDRRYAIDASRLKDELGWRAHETLDHGLRKTVAWYVDHADWIDAAMRGRYAGQRLGAHGA